MFKNAIDLFEVFGFKIKVDPSWLLIATLIVWSLASAYFPERLPALTRYDYIGLAIIAMLGLFSSLILHELSHSLVARQFDLDVGGITLFIFGGVAELEQEPKSPKSEFWIAIAGPLMSFAIAGLALMASHWLAALQASQSLIEVLNYLGFINLILGGFNLVPAFPLDGGRVLRAALWGWTGNVLRATKIASGTGTVFAIILISLGIFALFSDQIVGGLWQILIGFFIFNAARATYQQLVIKHTLKDQTVRSLMTSPAWSANVDSTIQSMVDDIMLGHNVSFVPVMEGGNPLGYVDTGLVQKIERNNWDTTKLEDIFISASEKNTISPDMSAGSLFQKMATNGQRKMMVVENGHLMGVISLSDMLSYLAITQGLGLPEHPVKWQPQ